MGLNLADVQRGMSVAHDQASTMAARFVRQSALHRVLPPIHTLRDTTKSQG